MNTQKRFKSCAMGGTFDLLHKGHIELLSKAFETSSFVVIGLSSDEFAAKRGKKLINNYEVRKENLEKLIEEKFPDGKYDITKLDDSFGPGITSNEIEALIASDETSVKINELNDLRRRENANPVELVIVPMALAKDGQRFSSTRLRNKEIDLEGNLL